jgi:hypothetical protein
MKNSTLRVRLFEASHHANALLAFVCLSNVLSVRQRLALIRVATMQHDPLLNPKGGV